MTAVAEYLKLPPIQVFEVASFYSMFETKPVGRHSISVCTNISCMLRGAYALLRAFERRVEGDKSFTIVEEECIAAGANAPAVICGTRYFLDVEPKDVDSILDELRKAPRPEGEVV